MISRRQFLATSAAAVTAQEAADIRITVALVQVDAVVTDGRGRHVSDLGPDDFEIRQDGELASIRHFAYVPEPPAEKTVRRTVALVVDDLSLSFEDLVRTREALRKFVHTGMRDGDLVAIVRTGGGVALLEQFTLDKRLLLASIDLLKWRFQGRAGLKAIDPVDTGEATGPAYLDYGAADAAVGALATLEYVLRGMRRLPGRKSIVYLASALEMAPEVTAAMDRLTDLANRSAVSLYTVDPSGLKVSEREKEPERAGGLADVFADTLGRAYPAEEGLVYLARKTGGLYYANNNDIPGCIRHAADDQMGYYLMGFRPREGTFEAKEAKRFHTVTVRLKRPGLRVRWKSGFLGISDEEVQRAAESELKTREEQLMDALVSPFLATGIGVRLTGVFLHEETLGARVHTMLHFQARDLTFEQQESGEWHAKVDIVTTAFRGLKQTAQQRERQEHIRLPDELYQKARKEGFLYLLDHRMAEPGMFLMRAVVRDVASGRMGAASQFVEVPDTRKGRFAMSGVLLRLAPKGILGEAPAKTADGEAAAWTEGGPAMRRYRPGQDLLYTYVAINPKVKGTPKRPDVHGQIRVFRNGKQIFAGKPMGLQMEAKLDDRHFVGAGVLRLGPRMTPGEYLLEVTVTDNRNRKQPARQWIDFEVTPS